MKLLTSLEHKFGKATIPNLTFYLIAGQVLVFVLSTINPAYQNLLYLQGDLVLEGQFWRLITFLFIPFARSPFFIIFAWYLYYLYGSALERHWGRFRYQIYIGLVYLLSLSVSFIFPEAVITNNYIYGSVFLAFAHLFPDFTLYLFFIIPVKVKWLGWLVLLGVINTIIFGVISQKVIAFVSILNYLIFFASDIIGFANGRKSPTIKEILKTGTQKTNYLTCEICKKTEKDEVIFYSCEKCKDSLTYCEEHIEKHTHFKK